MKLSVYIPKDLEEALRERASEAGESPSMFVQTVLRERLKRGHRRFSKGFLELAGSWEDDRSTDEILEDIERSRVDAERPVLD